MKQIKPYKTTLSVGNAYWMARLAKDVYKKIDKSGAPDDKAILQGLKDDDPDFLSVFGYDRHSAQAVLIEHKEYFTFAFRGTDQVADWLDNVNVVKHSALFGEFHNGFFQSLVDVWSPLYSRYVKLRAKKRRPVFFTGHSLGGAMATIAAAHFIHEDKPFTSVYTFGQPRALTLDTSRIFNMEAKKRYFRFQNNNDIVTRVPARVMGYSHVGSFLYISEEKKIYSDPGFWFRFLDAIDGAVEAVWEKGFDGVADHSMDKYLQAIESWKFSE